MGGQPTHGRGCARKKTLKKRWSVLVRDRRLTQNLGNLAALAAAMITILKLGIVFMGLMIKLLK